ncbi:hypothetical protein [Tautonia rosea]|uniref:hypothetical protein n=1 Tax=Tautonia rosea TaxID=2728037 RepID=UPI0014759740|nr:hypothetical protein [Tautonia rosea]
MDDPMPVGDPPQTSLRRLGLAVFPLGVVLLGMAWGRIASIWILSDRPEGIVTAWGIAAGAATAMMIALAIGSVGRRRRHRAWRLIALRCILTAVMLALIVLDPFVSMPRGDRSVVVVATAIIVPMAVCLWAFLREGSVASTLALSVFIAASAACIFFNLSFRGIGIGFFSRWNI